MNLKRSIYLLGNQLLNYISGRFNFEERRLSNCLIKNLYEMGIVASFKNLHEMHYPPLSEAR